METIGKEQQPRMTFERWKSLRVRLLLLDVPGGGVTTISCLGADFGLVLTEITVASDTPAPFRQVKAVEVPLCARIPEATLCFPSWRLWC